MSEARASLRAGQPEEPSLVRSTALMATGTLLSRITGLLRVTVLVATLGVSEQRLADVYNVANTTPNIIYELVLGGILSSVFVPVFVEVRRVRGFRQARLVANAVLTVTFVVLSLLAIATVLAAPFIIRIYIHSGTPEEQAQAQLVGGQLLAMFMPQIVFYGIGSVMTALLNANRRFGVPVFAPILNNLVVIAVGLTFHAMVGGRVPDLDEVTTAEKLLLGLGTTLGVVAMTMVQWPFLRRIGFRYSVVWNLRDAAIRKMARLSTFTIGYVVTNQLAYLIIPILAYLVQGGYTAYTTSFTFFQLPHGVFAVSVMTALLPPMSEQAIAKDWDAFRATLARGLRLTAAVLLPATIGYLVLAGPIVRLLMAHGVVSPNSNSTLLLTRTMVMFVLGLLPFSTFQLILRAFYALQNTRTTFLVNLVSTSVQVLANLVLFWMLPQAWKVPGLALGQTIGYTVGSVLLLWRLSLHIGGLGFMPILRVVARMLLASLIMGVLVAAVAAAVSAGVGIGTLGDLATVAAGVCVGLVAYFVAARLLHVDEVGAVLDLFRRRIRRHGGAGGRG
jgi:putative peptidoglycan lipid II flippase